VILLKWASAYNTNYSDSDCRSDEDEDDGASPAYATRFSAHGVKSLMWTGDDDRSNPSNLAPKIHKSKTSLTEQGLRANKTVLLDIGY